MPKGKLSSFIAAFGFPMAPLSSELCLLSSKEGIPAGPVAHPPAAWLTVCSPLASLTAAPEGELNSWRQMLSGGDGRGYQIRQRSRGSFFYRNSKGPLRSPFKVTPKPGP